MESAPLDSGETNTEGASLLQFTHKPVRRSPYTSVDFLYMICDYTPIN